MGLGFRVLGAGRDHLILRHGRRASQRVVAREMLGVVGSFKGGLSGFP